MKTPMFERRHYEAVAKTLRETKQSALVNVKEDTLHVWELVVISFERTFMYDNERFNGIKFREAAGYEDHI